MKRLWFILGFLLLTGNGYTPAISYLSEKKDLIKIGDKYEFDVKHGWLPVGKVTTEVLEKTNIRGYECFHLRSKMELGGIIRLFKSFSHQIDSWSTVDEFVTIQWRQYEKKDNRTKTIDIEIFPKTDEAIFKTVTAETTITTRKKILPKSRDFLGLLFLTRTMKKADLKPGNVIYTNALAENQHTSYLLPIKMLDKKTLEVGGNIFNCYRIKPLYQATGLFTEEGETIIWFDLEKIVIPLIERGSDKLILKTNK